MTGRKGTNKKNIQETLNLVTCVDSSTDTKYTKKTKPVMCHV